MTDLVAQLVGALEGMLALDEENHQRYPGDEDVCKEVQAAQAALTAAKAGGWQDISTAPKHPVCQDGNNHYSEYILAWWPGAIAPTRCRWWFRDDSEACNFLADGGYAVFPTVFQPLPAPPAQRGEG